MLKLENIIKDYGEKESAVRALKGINLQFRDSEFVSILGQSGCGKTTMLNIIGGLDRYTSGDLIIDGISTKNYKDVDWDTYRNIRIGFIFQSYNLIMHTDIVSNVEMALTLSGVSAKERRERAIKALEQVGLKEQMNKKPNQLSGGQMQRVSIARALINNPEILLADEPTGALDSATSIQIMELIKEIAKDRLVIMVTHNPELAEQYSTRIVKLSDGEVVSDSNPYIEEPKSKKEDVIVDTHQEEISKKEQRKATKEKKKKLAKTSMSFLTAIKLSFNNLMTKKGRTVLTAIAASIGIIGVSLVLAVSNGFNVYIKNMQQDMMAGYPITIAKNGFDMTSMMSLYMGQNGANNSENEYPSSNIISTYDTIDRLTAMAETMQNNNISEEYMDYLNENLPKDAYGSVHYSYDMKLNIIGKPYLKTFTSTKNAISLLPGASEYASMIFSGDGKSECQNIPNMSMMFSMNEITGNKDFIESQYDCLYGKFPENKSQIILVVNPSNQIGEFTMASLGLDPKKEYTFEEIMQSVNLNKMKAYANNEFYENKSTEEKDYFVERDYTSLYESDAECVELELVGIYRAKESVSYVTLMQGINYTSELTQYLLGKNYTSEIVNVQKLEKNKAYNVLDIEGKFRGTASDSIGSLFGAGVSITDRDSLLSVLGGDKTPSALSIYPISFESKAQITAVLDQWNAEHEKKDQVNYTDMASMIASMLSQMIKIITIALVCFSAVSLFVSSFMIAIITYVSVVERTKEIGILRALGARKKDISRVFNAETGIIGLCAGIFGVLITYILSIPINLIVNFKAGMVLNLCSLNPLTALAMIGLSIVLTLIAGLIPSRMAAKKDPVEALRSE